jgi:hypothetical protein
LPGAIPVGIDLFPYTEAEFACLSQECPLRYPEIAKGRDTFAGCKRRSLSILEGSAEVAIRFQREESPIGVASETEVALTTVLGLSLPFADFPLVVWRKFGVDLSHLAGGALILVAVLGMARRRRPMPPLSLALCSIALLLVPLVPYATHRLPGFDSGSFWRTYLHLGFMLAVFLAIPSCSVSWFRMRWILAVLVVEALIVALYGIWQTVAFVHRWPTGIEFLNRHAWHALRGDYGTVWRATATFEEPKWLSIYLLPAVCYAYALVLEAFRDRHFRVLASWSLALAIIAAAAIPTASLGGIPAMAVLMTVLVIHFMSGLQGRKRYVVSLVTAFSAIAAAVALTFSLGSLSRLLQNRATAEVGNVSGRVASGSEFTSGYIYARNFRYALALFRESPWFGVGVGQFAAVGKVRGQQLGFSPAVNADGPSIGFGGILAEWGLAGALILAWLLGLIYQGNRKTWGWPGHSSGVLAASLIFAVLLKEIYSGFYINLWTWFPLGLAAFAARISVDSGTIGAGGADAAPEDVADVLLRAERCMNDVLKDHQEDGRESGQQENRD